MSTLSEKIEMIEKLRDDHDFQHLLNESFEILKNPIMMYDTTDYNLIAYTEGIVTDDRFWNEITTNGKFCMESQEFFKKEGFIDDMANARVITFMLSDKLKYERISGKLFNKNNVHVVNLTIVACNKSFEPDDPAVFEALCNLFSQKISASRFYQDYENTYQELLITKLIDGSIVDRELYTAHIAILYGGLKTNLYVAVLDFTQCNPEYDKLTYFRDLFRGMQPAFKYAVYSNYIIIIISSDNVMLNIKKDLSKLNDILKRKNIYAGISSCFENIFELPTYYSDAVKALNFGLTSHSGQQIYLYDKIKAPPLT